MPTTMYGYTDVIDHVNVLRKQEETTYRCFDYLSQEFQEHQAMQEESLQNCLGRIRPNATLMNETWRDKICEWTYNIVDYFKYDRELVFVCMNFLDRYAMKRRVDTKTYQLAAITALFLVVKTYQPRSSSRMLDVSALAKLSQSNFDEGIIVAMELELLHMLEWNLFPPTAHTFATQLNKILLQMTRCVEECFPQPSSSATQEVIELTRFLTELSVCDYFFVTQLPSTVGIASLLNAIDLVGQDEFCKPLIQSFIRRVYEDTGLNAYSSEVQECRQRLQATFVESGFSKVKEESTTHNNNSTRQNNEDDETVKDEADSLNGIPSPVCVSGANP